MDLLKPSYASGYAKNASQSAHPNLWDGLVGAWMPSLGVTGETLRDVSGNGNHGTLNNMDAATDWVATSKGLALDYDGSNDYVNLGNASSLFPGPIITASLCCWIKPSTTSMDYVPIGDQYSLGHRLYIGIIDGLWDAGFGDYLWGNGYTGSRVTATIDWTFVSLIITAGSAVLYVNGQKTITKTTDTSVTLGGFFSLGAYFVNGVISGGFQGPATIGSTFIHNRALSPTEIKQLYVDSLAPFRTKKRTVVRVPAAIPAATKVGSIKKPTTIIKPSYQSGYARNASESENPQLWDGLVGAWMPSLGVTGETLRDVSGNGNHGTLVWDGIFGMNPAQSWGAGEKGTHLTFDGVNDYVNIGDKISAPKNLSIFSWVKCDNTSYFPILTKGMGVVGAREYMLFVFSGSIGAVVAHEPTGDVDALYGSAIGTNKWFYLGMTWDGSVLSVYRNGKLDASVSTSIPFIDDRSSELRIGRNAHNIFANGKITNTSIYNRALSPQEIKQLYVDSLAPFRRKQRVSVAVPAGIQFKPYWAKQSTQISGLL